MRTDSYVSILGAVANVLDLADARSFSVRDCDHGLTLDLVDGRGERHAIELSIAEVADLISWSEATQAQPRAPRESRDEGTLRAFLERHTLVGAR